MKIDGRAIAEKIYQKLQTEVATLPQAPTLGIVTCAPNAITQQYLHIKKARAEVLDIDVDISMLEATATTDDIVKLVQEKSAKGVPLVVQLPLPAHIDTDAVLQALPIDCDVDGLRFVEVADHPYLSPVAGAIAEIVYYQQIPLEQKKVVILGEGRLVGQPVAKWCRQVGADVMVQNKDTFDPRVIKTADIVISGVGIPKLVRADMVKEGVVLLDVGTSGSAGTLQGDIDPESYEKAPFYTPVPGGIGPITIAVLLENVIQASKKQAQEG